MIHLLYMKCWLQPRLIVIYLHTHLIFELTHWANIAVSRITYSFHSVTSSKVRQFIRRECVLVFQDIRQLIYFGSCGFRVFKNKIVGRLYRQKRWNLLTDLVLIWLQGQVSDGDLSKKNWCDDFGDGSLQFK